MTQLLQQPAAQAAAGAPGQAVHDDEVGRGAALFQLGAHSRQRADEQRAVALAAVAATAWLARLPIAVRPVGAAAALPVRHGRARKQRLCCGARAHRLGLRVHQHAARACGCLSSAALAPLLHQARARGSAGAARGQLR